MSPDQTPVVLRAALTLAAPALVLAAGLRWTVSRLQLRLAKVSAGRSERRPV